MGIIQSIGQKIGGGLEKVRTYLGKKISDPIQRDSYGSGTTIGGTTVYTTPSGDSGTTPTYTGGGGGGGRATTTTSTPTTTPSGVTTYQDIKLPTPSPSVDIRTQQSLRGEIYDPRKEIYRKSVYGIGAGGTQYERPPTYEERRRIEIAQEKPGKIRKYMEDPTGKRKLEEPKDVFGEQYTYKELYKAGALPTIVRKASSRAGLFFVGLGEKITGGEVPPKLKKKTSQALGTLFLFSGFAPAMRTGTYSEEISKQLSKTKFDKLKDLLAKAEKKVAEQKTLQDQAKILKEIKDTLKTPEQIKNYNLWVKSLKDKGVLHSVKVDVKQLGEYKPSTITGEISVDIPKQIPVEKIGVVAIDPSKVRDVNWMGEKAKVDQVQEPLSMNIFQEPQKVKEFLVSTSALRFQQLQKQKLDIKQKQKFIQPQKEVLKEAQIFKQASQLKQAQLQKQRQIQREKLTQLQKQVQISRLKAKLEPKFKFPFKLGDAIKKVTKIAKEKPEEFKVFVTKFGKEVEIGVRKTKKEAEELLKEKLFGTLRAGGGIKLGGKKLKAEEIKLGIGFAKSKIDPFKVIEKKERRLKRGTQEVPEIQLFRKKPRGGGKSRSLFGI